MESKPPREQAYVNGPALFAAGVITGAWMVQIDIMLAVLFSVTMVGLSVLIRQFDKPDPPPTQ